MGSPDHDRSAPARTTGFETRATRGGGGSYRGLAIFAAPGLHEHVAALVRESFPDGARVVDLGAGTGALSLRLADQGHAVTAVELAHGVFGAGERVELVVGDLDGPVLAGRAGTFDAVVAVEILEHVENPRRFLRDAFALLRPGGTAFVTTPNVASPVSKARFLVTGEFQWFTREDRASLGHVSPLSPWHLRDALAGAGFVDIELSDFGDPFERVRGWTKLVWAARLFGRLARGSGDPDGDLLVARARRPERSAPR